MDLLVRTGLVERVEVEHTRHGAGGGGEANGKAGEGRAGVKR